MKLTEDSSSLAEHKLLVLYILNKIGKPINQKALLELVTSITELNYFYFQQFLLDLIENKYVISYKKDDELLYNITPLLSIIICTLTIRFFIVQYKIFV